MHEMFIAGDAAPHGDAARDASGVNPAPAPPVVADLNLEARC